MIRLFKPIPPAGMSRFGLASSSGSGQSTALRGRDGCPPLLTTSPSRRRRLGASDDYVSKPIQYPTTHPPSSLVQWTGRAVGAAEPALAAKVVWSLTPLRDRPNEVVALPGTSCPAQRVG